MNCRRSTNRAPLWLSLLAMCGISVSILSTWNGSAVAEDKPAARQPQVQFGPPATQPGASQPKADVWITAPTDVQIQIQQLQKRREELDRDYQEQIKEILKSMPRPAQIEVERQEMEKRLSEAGAKIAELSGKQNQIMQERVMVAPLPDNAMLRAFTLKYVKPEEIGQALHNITGGGGPRIAVDERTNALVIAGTEKQMSVAEQLVQTLDQPGADQKGKSAEMLQLRVVWIVDGLPDTEGKNVEPPYVSPQVLEGLVDLGFETPRVMCQQVCMLTLDKGNRGGQFQFQLPVLVQGNPWQFEGQGFIASDQSDRYSMQFNLNLRQPKKEGCQLSGSINTPLAHYNVLGTTTFVDEPQTSPPGGGMEQHLSAFVVYLDHPREFGEKKTTEKAR